MNAKSPTKKFSQQTRFFVVAGVVGVLVLTYFFYQAFGGAVLGVTLTTNPALENGLLAYYTFDGPDFITGTVTDSSGNGKDLSTGVAESNTASSSVFTTAGTSTWVVPTGVTSITIKAWGAGGGAGGSVTAEGGQGGGGGFAQATISVTPADSFSILVGGGGGGGGGASNQTKSAGGGGGGYSGVHKSNAYSLIAAGGGGGGNGFDNAPDDGGVGGPGGGTNGDDGGRGYPGDCNSASPDSGEKGGGATQSAGGAAGAGCTVNENGAAGASRLGGEGGDGGFDTAGGTAGTIGGGRGGDGKSGGGGGGGGYFGGGGGERGANQGGGGGGGGSSYSTSTASATSTTAGSGTTPGNNGDADYAGSAGVGAATTTTNSDGAAGSDGLVVLSYTIIEGNGSLSQTQGTIGQGSSFDGLTGVASSTSAINNVKTIAFWARPTTTTQNILELGPSGKTVTLASGVVTTGLASPTVYVDGVQTTTFPDTNWHHVVITTGTAVNATTFQIGVASSTYYGGSLDDVRLYSRALAQSEITRLYQLGATTKVGVTLDTNPANANGLVAWWTLDGVNIDLSNNTGEIRDRSGQGNNGDWKNHASTTAPGTVGQAISFDGIDDYVATSSGTTIASVQSIAFWMRIATSTATQKVLNLQGQGTIRVNTNASGQLIVTGLAGSEIMYIDGVATTTALASSAVNTSWHHVVITTGTSFTVNNLTLGRVTTQYFGGSLDDVRLYTRLLSPAEVLRLYQLGATTRVGVSLKSALDLPAGLVGWWTFDGPDMDLSNNTAEVRDRSVSSINGDWKNHATTTAPGVIGQAISFDGVDDFIDLGSNYAFQPTDAFSIGGWVYSNETGSAKGVISRRAESGNAGWELAISTTNQINFILGSTDTSKYWVSTNANVYKPGTWMHIFATYNGSQDASGMAVYINGVLEPSLSISDNDSGASITYTDNAKIGSTRGSLFFIGALDDMRVYNRALSPAEILRLYQLGR